MIKRHVLDDLVPYLDGNLDPGGRGRVEAHLAQCNSCQHTLNEVRVAKTLLQDLPLSEAPESLWSGIEAAADASARPQSARWAVWKYALAASVIVAAMSAYWNYSRQPMIRWEVATLDGTPVAGNRPIGSKGAVPMGAWIETDARSRARIRVGEIGSVEIGPDSRLRLVAGGAGEHRLALESGQIVANVSAPPRLFVVDTPAATAVDLGCEYRIQCDRNGTGILKVSQGWVSLEWRRRESLVPAGASCRMRSGRGPGTPWFDDAPTELVQALHRFDDDANSPPDNLQVILGYSRTRDTLTLWHLLSNTQAVDRARVYERMIRLTGTPAGISREAVLTLDRQALLHWKDELAWIW